MWGAVGEAVAYVAVFVLPRVRMYVEKGITWPGLPRLLGIMFTAVLYIGMGGLVAFLVNEATLARHAVAYGIAWESLFKATTSAANATAGYNQRI